MNIPGLIYVLVAHYLCGRGILRLLKMELKPVATTCLSVIVGVPLLSLAPCALQLCGIPITFVSVFAAIAVFTGICSIPLLRHIQRPKWWKPALPELYEWPFLVVCFLLWGISVWRCFYYPPTPRDMLSGPELLAEYAIREQTMISSVFQVDLHSTNNYFKSPFITSLQIIYKLLVSPFGQMWLSVLFTAFTVWIYTLLRERLHPILAGFLLLFFITMPDLYAYSYMMLYDYSNMVLYFCGYYFLTSYMQDKKSNTLLFSALCFGLATFIRTETMVLVTMMAPLLLFYLLRNRISMKTTAAHLSIFLLVPALCYLLCNNVFIRAFVPIPFDVSSLVNPNLRDVGLIFRRMGDMNKVLIFSMQSLTIYGYFIWFFCGLLLVDLAWPRKFNREALNALYGIAVVYVGMALLGYLLPLFDVINTTKRGLFKLLPIMLLYMANSGLLLQLSAVIRKWEFYKKKEKIVDETVQ